MSFDVICLVETWLSDDLLNSELFPSDYSVIRRDRNFDSVNRKRGGGVLLAHKPIGSVQTIDLSVVYNNLPLIDILGCTITINRYKLYIYVLYIPPDISAYEFEYFFELFEDINACISDNILILGDFNISQFNDHTINDNKSNIVNNFMHFVNVNQINNVLNNHQRLLDLIFTNITLIDIHRELIPLVVEDTYHPPISLVISLKINRLSKTIHNNVNAKQYNFRRADFRNLYASLLTTDWTFLYNFNEVNQACDAFYNEIYKLFDHFVPLKNNNSHKYPVWFTKQHINDIIAKDKYRLKYSQTKSVVDGNKYKELRARIKINSHILYNNYITSIQSSIISDPKQFWAFVRSKRAKAGIPTSVKTSVGMILHSPQNIVNGFADYFESVYLPCHSSNPLPIYSNSPLINIVNFAYEEVLKSLKSMKNSFTMGSDNIPSFFVKDCASALVDPLCFIFNLALNTCVFPDRWKITRLTPVFKKGEVDKIDNYRPIAIINNFAKVFEKCLYLDLLPQVKSLISIHQHGFISKRSTISNLAVFSQYICESLDNNVQVDVIYTDFTKAFDRIDHDLLLHKLQSTGFTPKLVSLFCSYLQNRKHFVSYIGYTSHFFCPSSGVPQGTNLGPLLFLLFINDLCDQLECEKVLFADDLKIFSRIHVLDDCENLQSQIDVLKAWCNQNKLNMSIPKCKVVSFTRKSNPLQHCYKFDDTELQRCTSVKDLGVTFDSKFTFWNHVSEITSSALKILGFIIRTTRCFTSIDAILPIYYSFIRSKLEYASLIWSPIYINQVSTLELVQRRFMKYLHLKVNGFYPVRGYPHDLLLNQFGMDALSDRRNLSSIVFLYNLLHDGVDAPDLLNKINFHVPRISSRSDVTFYCARPRTNILLRSPIHRICHLFDSTCNDTDIHHISLSSLLNMFSSK